MVHMNKYLYGFFINSKPQNGKEKWQLLVLIKSLSQNLSVNSSSNQTRWWHTHVNPSNSLAEHSRTHKYTENIDRSLHTNAPLANSFSNVNFCWWMLLLCICDAAAAGRLHASSISNGLFSIAMMVPNASLVLTVGEGAAIPPGVWLGVIRKRRPLCDEPRLSGSKLLSRGVFTHDVLLDVLKIPDTLGVLLLTVVVHGALAGMLLSVVGVGWLIAAITCCMLTKIESNKSVIIRISVNLNEIVFKYNVSNPFTEVLLG